MRNQDRINLALELLALQSSGAEVAAALQTEYEISRASAYRLLKNAREAMELELGLKRDQHVALVLHQIHQVIAGAKISVKVRLAAIQMKIKLLGLGAPTKTETVISVFDPAETAVLTNPELRAKILAIEEEVSKFHEQTTTTKHAGADRD